MIVYPNMGMGSAGSSITQAVGGSVAAASPLAGPAAPIVAAVGGLIALAGTIAGAIHLGEGCGPTCVQATQIVNQAEPIFKQNLDGYESGILDQSTALDNFNKMKIAIQQACSGIPGKAGTDCYGDRFTEGGCKWQDNGTCWNWNVGYRDPLLKPATTPYQGASSLVSSAESLFSGIPTMLLIGGGLLLVGLSMGGKN